MNTCLLIFCLALGGGGDSARDRAPQPDRFFAEDKLKHFFTSFIVTSLSASGARAAGLDHDTSMWVGAGTGAAVGIAKELNDLRSEGETASFLDLVWDFGGIGAATIVQAQTGGGEEEN